MTTPISQPQPAARSVGPTGSPGRDPTQAVIALATRSGDKGESTVLRSISSGSAPTQHPNGHSTSSAPARSLRVALLDADPRAHASVSAALTPWQLISYTSPHSALESLPGLAPPPDVVLMETDLPSLSGVECLKKLRHIAPNLPVVMFSGCSDATIVFESVRAGAHGYLVKPITHDFLRQALEGAASGRRAFGTEAQAALVDFVQRLGVSGPARVLTSREREIMQLMAQGYQSKEIAGQLHLSPKTIPVHMRHIFKKLQVHRKADALSIFLSGSGV